MNLKDIDWDTLDAETFVQLKTELGSDLIDKCISLYGCGYTNEQIADMVSKLKSED